ncbi:MAG: alpha/beta fold hydrolase [Actinomycetota bacterium]
MALQAINGTELHVETIGSGPPLLLMHGGLGLDHAAFRPYFDRLADRYTVIYYDHRGNGRSARLVGDPPELTFDELVGDAVGVLDALGLERATVLGHSYGGFIAQSLAAAHQDRLAALVLMNTVPAFDYAPEPSGTDEQLAAFGSLFTGPIADDETFGATWSTVWPLYFHQYPADDAARIHGETAYSASGWNASAGLLGTFNTLEALPTIETPTLCVGGGHDFITPPDPGARRLTDLLPAAELAVFDDSGHYPFIEESDAFFATLEAFLARVH